MIDIHAIRRDNPLPDVAGKLVALRPAGREWVACCPFHADRSPSFTIYNDGARFQCFGCGASGDVLDFVQRAYGVPFREAVRMLGGGDLPTASHCARAVPAEQLKPENSVRRREAARAIWSKAIAAAGTPAEAYLRLRGIDPPYPPNIRFTRLACDDLGRLPCLVAAVRDVAGDVTGIQRIWLAPGGMGKAAIPKPKRSLGMIRGGAIRLGDLDAGGMVTVCEGPEDGLSLLAMIGAPVWVAAGVSFLPAMQFPVEVRSILMAADNDARGLAGAQEAARAFASRGLPVRLIRPLEGFKDFNDELRGARA